MNINSHQVDLGCVIGGKDPGNLIAYLIKGLGTIKVEEWTRDNNRLCSKACRPRERPTE